MRTFAHGHLLSNGCIQCGGWVNKSCNRKNVAGDPAYPQSLGGRYRAKSTRERQSLGYSDHLSINERVFRHRVHFCIQFGKACVLKPLTVFRSTCIEAYVALLICRYLFEQTNTLLLETIEIKILQDPGYNQELFGAHAELTDSRCVGFLTPRKKYSQMKRHSNPIFQVLRYNTRSLRYPRTSS